MSLKQPQQLFRGFRLATMTSEGNRLDAAMGVVDGHIAWMVPDAELPPFPSTIETVEGGGRWLTPGLIDCHTHLVFGGNRASEWQQRLAGVSYEQIARAGGGILSTLRATRAATVDELVDSAAVRLRRLMSEGVTTVEIKSGYGLDLESELKMLRAARQLESRFDVGVETTLLAAHAVPPEFKGRADEYVELVCDEIIPAARELCSSVDVFCESIAFSVDQTCRVFEAAQSAGLNVKVHAEQLTHTGIAAIAAQRGALSADHLECLTDADCRVMGQHDTVATLLPGAYYCLRETRKPPVESLRHHGVPIAIATDCNPGSSPVTSLLLAANMGCTLFGLTVEESLAAISANAARALGLSDQIGTIEPGRRADFAVWDVETPAEIIYGIGHNPCHAVYRAGRLRNCPK